ncbi:thioredoxin-like protein [Butyriboletus roseoflavus]|nr:thioredoxin-like protein [Butyriboletus roseoflavus]
MTVRKITSVAQFDALLESNKIIFIDFYADWCGPCKQISPIFERLAGDNAQNGVEFYKVDIDQVPDLAGTLGIRSIPTFHAYKGKERLDQVVGADRAGLETLIQICRK